MASSSADRAPGHCARRSRELARPKAQPHRAPVPTSPAAFDVKGAKVVAAARGSDIKRLRETMDQLKDKLKSAAIAGERHDGKVTLIAGYERPRRKAAAGDLSIVAQQVGARVAGVPTWRGRRHQSRRAALQALQSVERWVGERLESSRND